MQSVATRGYIPTCTADYETLLYVRTLVNIDLCHLNAGYVRSQDRSIKSLILAFDWLCVITSRAKAKFPRVFEVRRIHNILL